MAKRPEWANERRIIYDKELPLAFIKENGAWRPYAVNGSTLTLLGTANERKLAKTREAAIKSIGKALSDFAMALHPHSRNNHFARYEYSLNKPGGWQTLCGVDYGGFHTTSVIADTTCPVCLAVLTEDLRAQIGKTDPEALEIAVDHVRTVRAFNALGQTVNSEDATTKL